MSYPYQYTENQSTPSTPYAQSPWEIEQSQELFHQQQQQPQPQTFEQHQTIQLPEPERIVPSQNREPIPLHSVHSHEGRSDRDAGDVKPRINVNTTRPSSAETSTSMLMRHSPIRPHVQLTSHPYRRPRSAAAGAAATIIRHRRDQEPQHVRFAGRAIGSSTPMESPASAPPRMTSFGSTFATASSPTGSYGLSSAPKAQARRFIIRSDVHYDAESKIITAMLELPGVKKSELSIKLSTCVYNRVRQVTVSGRSKPVFPEIGLAVKERKFGDFVRTFPVPPDTTAGDIQADMQDGILVLKISCRVSAEADEPQDIPIR